MSPPTSSPTSFHLASSLFCHKKCWLLPHSFFMMEAPFHKFHSITWTVELFDPQVCLSSYLVCHSWSRWTRLEVGWASSSSSSSSSSTSSTLSPPTHPRFANMISYMTQGPNLKTPQSPCSSGNTPLERKPFPKDGTLSQFHKRDPTHMT